MATEDSKTTRGAESNVLSDIATGFGQMLFGPEGRSDIWYGAGIVSPPYFIDSQKRGEVLPAYLSEYGLKVIRDRSRRLFIENETCSCIKRNRLSYIVGTGFRYRVLPKHERVSESLLARTQNVVDVFLEANRLSLMAQEAVVRGDRDGEGFIRIFPQDKGLLLLRWTEPEHVKAPYGDSLPARSFGIETDPQDVMSVRGYWVVENPLHSTVPHFVPATRIVHYKCNVDSAAKRGLPLTYPIEANLRRVEEILAAISTTIKIQAKIAMIRHVEGSTKNAVTRLKDSLETQQTFDPITGGATNVEEFKFGSILTSSGNIKYEFPKSSGVESPVEVLKAEYRAIAAAMVMTESMVSADASGGTGTAQLVQEAPATRNFEREQRFYCDLFGESRAPGNESLVWRQIAYAVECGVLPEEVLHCVRIVTNAPDIIQRDPDKAAAADKAYLDMGATSPQIICSQLGNDWKQVTDDRKAAGLMPLNAAAIPPDAQGQMAQEAEAQPPPEFSFDGAEFT